MASKLERTEEHEFNSELWIMEEGCHLGMYNFNLVKEC